MRKQVIVILFVVVIGLYELSRMAMQLPGSSRSGSNNNSRRPKTKADLKEEFQDKLPDSVYQVFESGAEFQIHGMDEQAEQEYAKLERIPRRSGGTFDLSAISKVLQHNLSLLLRRRK